MTEISVQLSRLTVYTPDLFNSTEKKKSVYRILLLRWALQRHLPFHHSAILPGVLFHAIGDSNRISYCMKKSHCHCAEKVFPQNLFPPTVMGFLFIHPL